MHIAIVDDLESDRCSLGDLLERYFESVGMNLAMDVYESGEAFLQRTTDSEYDLVFLDIFMKELTGMEVARQMAADGSRCPVIFLTTSMDYALEGYEVGAFRYLLKPVDQAKLEQTLSVFMDRFQKGERKLPLMVDRTRVFVPYRDLYFLSSVMRTTEVHMKNKVWKQSSAINFQKTVAPLENDSRFRCCSKGIVVNLSHVTGMEKDAFILDNGEAVPISRRNMAQAKRQYLDFSLGSKE